jgi:threonyl-tRNA synthetase
VADDFADHLDEVITALRAAGVRAELDRSDDRMQKKIRTHTTQKVPLMLIAGAQDRDGGTVSFRFRDGTQENGVPIADAVRRIQQAIASKTLVNTVEDFA